MDIDSDSSSSNDHEILIPKEDSRVRNWLRILSQPMTLFGEQNEGRKQRLRNILEQMKLEELDQLNFDSGSEDDEKKESFSLGVNDLKTCRQNILKFSIARASRRLQQHRSELQIPFSTRKKIFHDYYSTLYSFETKTVQIGDERPIGFCKFTPNSKILGTSSWTGDLKLWDVNTSKELRIFKGHQDRVSAFDFHPQSTLTQSLDAVNIITGAADGDVRLWSLNSTTSIGSLKGHSARVARLSFHPSGNYAGTASFDRSWRLWDVQTQTELLNQNGHSREVFAISFQGDGALVATGGYDSVGRIWDLRTGRSIMTLRSHIKPILAIDFSPNGYQIATGGEDNTVRIWDIRATKSLYTIPAHTSSVTSIRFWHSNESFESNMYEDWSLDEPNIGMQPNDNYIEGSNISRRQLLDGSFLVTCSYDGTCKLWTDGDFKPVRALSGLEGKIMCCDISSGCIASGAKNTKIADSWIEGNSRFNINIQFGYFSFLDALEIVQFLLVNGFYHLLASYGFATSTMKCKMVATALYDYEAKTNEELTIKEGNMLLITNDSDPDWWEAVIKSFDTFDAPESGLVPLTYVEEAIPICVAKGMYDYDPAMEEEIELREGDLVRVYVKVDNDWWFVKIENEVGLIPASYVEEDPHYSGPVPVPQIPIAVIQEVSGGEEQKNKLMHALDGFGFTSRKSESAPTGIIYGPDDATYYNVIDVDRKKKKNSVKGLMGVSQEDKTIYFLEPTTKEIQYRYHAREVKKFKEKRTILKIELENGDIKEYEGEKSDIQGLFVHIETAVKTKDSPVSTGLKKPTIIPAPESARPSVIPPPMPVVEPARPSVIPPPMPVVEPARPSVLPPPMSVVKSAASPAKPGVALYDYDATNEEELTIREEDELLIIDESDPDWWLVRLINGKEGLVPKTYVEARSKAAEPDVDKIAEIEQLRAQEERKKMEQERIRRAEQERERMKQEEEQRRQAAIPKIPERPTQVQPAVPNRPPPVEPNLPTRASPVAPIIPARPIAAPPIKTPQIPNRPDMVQPTRPPPGRPETIVKPNVPISKQSTSDLSAPKKELTKPNSAKLRKWADASGKFEVSAEYLGIKDGKVELHKANGHIINVPLTRLGESSIEYLRSLPGNSNILGGKAQAPSAPTPSAATPKTPRFERKFSSDIISDNVVYNGFNWREWLIKAGVATNDANRYATEFVNQKLDSSILADIDREALRAMKISEGDIIRIRRAANLPAVTSATRAKTAQNEKVAEMRNLERLVQNSSIGKINESSKQRQMLEDEALARRLQEEERASTKGLHSNAQAGNVLSPRSSSVSQPQTTRISTLISNNDPWADLSNSNSKVSNEIKQKQQETENALETARLAIQRANEEAKKAAMLEEQAKARQTEFALRQAQETAKNAMLMQQQAHAKLLAAQTSVPQHPVVMEPPMPLQQPLIPTRQMAPMSYGMMGQMTNSMSLQGMSNLNNQMGVMPNQNTGMVGMGQFNSQSGPIMTNVTTQGVQKPNWNQATPSQPFGGIKNSDPYAAFKDVNPSSPSVFNNVGSLNPNPTGNSVAFSSNQSHMMQNNMNMANTGAGNFIPPGNMAMNMNVSNQGMNNWNSNPQMNMQRNMNMGMQNQNAAGGMNTGMSNQMMQGGMNIGIPNQNVAGGLNTGMSNQMMQGGMNMGMSNQMNMQGNMGVNNQMMGQQFRPTGFNPNMQQPNQNFGYRS